MSMTILNNPSAMMTLGQLNKNINKAGKDLKKVSSGMKINSAGDDSSAYSISERMRAQIRSLRQDIDNVKNGRSLLKVAAGGIDNIVDELRNLKELALNSANDHNSDKDRETLNRDFEQKIANINDIATETNYNGKILLDGRYGLSIKKDIVEIPDMPSAGSVTGGSTFYITNDGAYTINPGFTGNIVIQANNVELIGPGSRLTDVSIYGNSSGNLNLMIKDLDIYESNTHRPAIQFYGSNNTLSLKGTNSIEVGTITRSMADCTTINIGGGLTIQAGDETGTLNMINHSEEANGACIGTRFTDASNSPSSNLTINSGTINITTRNCGAAIGSDSGAAIGDITINGGNITINHSSDYSAAIGSGWGGSSAGDIVIKSGANINILSNNRNPVGAAIGTGEYSSAGNITLENGSYVNITGNWYNTVGAGEHGTVGVVTDNSSSGERIEQYEGMPLVIQIGTKANDAINVYINDMHTDSLGLDGVDILNQQSASSALDVIDSAIEYALDEATTVGSYISRLDFTEDNLVTANENTQASESTIRDADMAKEMTEYTRSNVLAQAAQSMLAQANQNSSSVLSLLQ